MAVVPKQLPVFHLRRCRSTGPSYGRKVFTKTRLCNKDIMKTQIFSRPCHLKTERFEIIEPPDQPRLVNVRIYPVDKIEGEES